MGIKEIKPNINNRVSHGSFSGQCFLPLEEAQFTFVFIERIRPDSDQHLKKHNDTVPDFQQPQIFPQGMQKSFCSLDCHVVI